MPEYRVNWRQCPHVHHTNSVLFVVANNEDDAKAIAKDHIERKFGIAWFSIFSATLTEPVPEGRVVYR